MQGSFTRKFSVPCWHPDITQCWEFQLSTVSLSIGNARWIVPWRTYAAQAIVLVCNHTRWDPLEVWHCSQSISHQAPDKKQQQKQPQIEIQIALQYPEQHWSSSAAVGARWRTACRNGKPLINGRVISPGQNSFVQTTKQASLPEKWTNPQTTAWVQTVRKMVTNHGGNIWEYLYPHGCNWDHPAPSDGESMEAPCQQLLNGKRTCYVEGFVRMA